MECVRHAVQGARQGRGAVLAELAPLPCSRSSVLLCARLDARREARVPGAAPPCLFPTTPRDRRARRDADAGPDASERTAARHDARRSDRIAGCDVNSFYSIFALLVSAGANSFAHLLGASPR